MEQDGPCICMYVWNTIQNSILYIGFTYMYVFYIMFCMVLSTWLHTTLLYEGLDNVFVLPNLQTPSFKFSQVVFAPLQKFVLMSFQCKLLSQHFAKLHRSHMTLDQSKILVKQKALYLLQYLKISTHLTS